jgi:hypothetical protein
MCPFNNIFDAAMKNAVYRKRKGVNILCKIQASTRRYFLLRAKSKKSG